MMTARDTLSLRQFPIVVHSECKNISHIYPLKQNAVAKVYSVASASDIVKKVYIFGSSVTGKCHIGSDLDICIDADVSDGKKVYDLQKDIGEICNWNCDILMFSNMGNKLKETVQKEGVVIYEQFTSES